MTRAYRWLTLAILVGSVALAVFARAPKTAQKPAPTIATAPAESLLLEIASGTIRPQLTVVSKGTSVTLAVRNLDEVSRRLALAGYEDRWISESIGARGSAIIRFRADRPGEDFAWLVDGRPAGRFVVAGPHLEEGHE